MRNTTIFLMAALMALGFAGCATEVEPEAEPPAEGQEQSQSQPAVNDESVGIVSPAAGGASPVTNASSVQGGGGGGVGQAAKNQARDAAGQSGSSIDQLEDY